MAGVADLQRGAAVRESNHNGLVVTKDLQTAEEQRLTLASRHHHLEKRHFTNKICDNLQSSNCKTQRYSLVSMSQFKSSSQLQSNC